MVRTLLLVTALAFVINGCTIEESPTTPRGFLRVTAQDASSNPIVGASIWLDEIQQQVTTPAVIGPLASGRHIVAVRKQTFLLKVDTIQVGVADTTNFVSRLQLSAQGYIRVSSNPPDAKVIVDEQFAYLFGGTTIITTPYLMRADTGIHNVSVSKTGYRTVTPSLHRIRVPVEDTVAISFDLAEATYGRTVGSLPTSVRQLLVTADTARRDSVSVEQFRGNLTMVTCWFTTCDPCRHELPYFDQAYRDYYARGARFIAMTTLLRNQTAADVRDAASQVGITFPVTVDSSFYLTMTQNFGAFPLNVLVDSTGTVISSTGALTEPELRTLIEAHLPR